MTTGNKPVQCKRHNDVTQSQAGFTLIEVMMAMLILVTSAVMVLSAIPLATMVHRGALEREIALALAQDQMEFYLTNPGPTAGTNGNKNMFVNKAQFPPGYTGSIRAQQLAGGNGLIQIIISVKPPHASKVEISAIDTALAI